MKKGLVSKKEYDRIEKLKGKKLSNEEKKQAKKKTDEDYEG